MIKKILRHDIHENYPKLKLDSIQAIKSSGMMNTIFIGKNSLQKYVIKLYKSNNQKKIISEHAVLRMINDYVPQSISYVKNRDQQTYTYSKQLNKYYGVYKYLEGISPASLKKTTIQQVIMTVATLNSFQASLSEKKGRYGRVIRRNIESEFEKNIASLRKVLRLLQHRKRLSDKEKTIRDVLIRKLKQIPTDQIEFNKISQSSVGIIHGDFAPTNLIFGKKGVNGIIDWENACVYSRVWEIFRSLCYCSNESSHGIICTKLNEKKVRQFLKTFFSKDNVLTKKDVEALKLMPKYYYFLDPFIVTSYCLEGNKKAGTLISKKVQDHFWLETYHNRFVALINQYANRKP